MKGVAGNLGANDLSTAARELEVGIKDPDVGKAAPLLEHFAVALRQVVTAIAELEQSEKIVRSSEAAGLNDAESLDIAKLTPVFKQLANLLEDDDMEAAKYLDAHKEELKGLNVAQELHKIEEHIGQYDFEQALEVLSGVAKKLCLPLSERMSIQT